MKKYLVILFAIVFGVLGCNDYGPTKSSDFEVIENSILEFGQDSVNIVDEKELKVFLKSKYSEDDDSFEKLESLVFWVIADKYRPTMLDLNKIVEITIEDSEHKSRSRKIKIARVFKVKEVIDQSLEVIGNLFMDSYATENLAINSFMVSTCFDNLKKNGITEVNITGLKKSEKGNYEAHFRVTAGENYDLLMVLNENNEPTGFFCDERIN